MVDAETVLSNPLLLVISAFTQKLWLLIFKDLGVILSASKLELDVVRKNLLPFEMSSSSRFLLVKLSIELLMLERESDLNKLCLVWGWLKVNEDMLLLLSCDLSGEKRALFDFSNLFTNSDLSGCWTTVFFDRDDNDLAGLWNSCLLEDSLDGPGFDCIWVSVLKNKRFLADELGVFLINLFLDGVFLLGVVPLRLDFLLET